MTGRAETQAPRWLLAGAAGQIGTTLRQGRRGHDEVLRLTDMAEMAVAACSEEVQCGEEGMLADLSQVMDEVNAVIHLGGIPDEDTDERIRAAHRAGVRRMAFWSPWRFASACCCRSRSKPAISSLGSRGVTLWHAHAFAAPDTSSLTVAGISANTQSWLKPDG
ncbi:NAD-dependent epimerase/dehydratase family protein [Deinococcus detaillensis]|uniref:hypothetical protein n=1 Tax=Deinococcus detaillensis TaxID=2592048 RepID=UPI00163DA1A7|nr:hypothetical protein [Deinococcus detaillensis]